jgi:hypothetical protein
MEDIRNLFPTEEMYNEFLSFQQMNNEERNDFANKNSARFNSLSKEEQKKELADIKSGIEKTVEFTDEMYHKNRLHLSSCRRAFISWLLSFSSRMAMRM